MPGMIAISTKISGSDWNLKHSFLIYILVTLSNTCFFLFPHNAKLDIVLCSYLNIKVRLANCYNSQTDVQVYKVNCRCPFTPKLFFTGLFGGSSGSGTSQSLFGGNSSQPASGIKKYVLIWKIRTPTIFDFSLPEFSPFSLGGLGSGQSQTDC